MIAYLIGKLTFKSPAFVTLECNQVGYHVNISVHTYSKVQDLNECKLYTYYYLKEQALPTLYGFADELERDLFLEFIGVSGIGTNTARMILSSYQPLEIQQAVVEGNVKLLQSIKGIGAKSAQRIVLELKDKFSKKFNDATYSIGKHNTPIEEALRALLALGISKQAGHTAVAKVLKEKPEVVNVEDLVREALKKL